MLPIEKNRNYPKNLVFVPLQGASKQIKVNSDFLKKCSSCDKYLNEAPIRGTYSEQYLCRSCLLKTVICDICTEKTPVNKLIFYNSTHWNDIVKKMLPSECQNSASLKCCQSCSQQLKKVVSQIWKVCRCCEGKNSLEDIFVPTNSELRALLFNLFNVSVSADDGLPKYICMHCKVKIHQSKNFFDKVTNLQAKFLEIQKKHMCDNFCNLPGTNNSTVHSALPVSNSDINQNSKNEEKAISLQSSQGNSTRFVSVAKCGTGFKLAGKELRVISSPSEKQPNVNPCVPVISSCSTNQQKNINPLSRPTCPISSPAKRIKFVNIPPQTDQNILTGSVNHKEFPTSSQCVIASKQTNILEKHQETKKSLNNTDTIMLRLCPVTGNFVIVSEKSQDSPISDHSQQFPQNQGNSTKTCEENQKPKKNLGGAASTETLDKDSIMRKNILMMPPKPIKITSNANHPDIGKQKQFKIFDTEITPVNTTKAIPDRSLSKDTLAPAARLANMNHSLKKNSASVQSVPVIKILNKRHNAGQSSVNSRKTLNFSGDSKMAEAIAKLSQSRNLKFLNLKASGQTSTPLTNAHAVQIINTSEKTNCKTTVSLLKTSKGQNISVKFRESTPLQQPIDGGSTSKNITQRRSTFAFRNLNKFSETNSEHTQRKNENCGKSHGKSLQASTSNTSKPFTTVHFTDISSLTDIINENSKNSDFNCPSKKARDVSRQETHTRNKEKYVLRKITQRRSTFAFGNPEEIDISSRFSVCQTSNKNLQNCSMDTEGNQSDSIKRANNQNKKFTSKSVSDLKKVTQRRNTFVLSTSNSTNILKNNDASGEMSIFPKVLVRRLSHETLQKYGINLEENQRNISTRDISIKKKLTIEKGRETADKSVVKTKLRTRFRCISLDCPKYRTEIENNANILTRARKRKLEQMDQ